MTANDHFDYAEEAQAAQRAGAWPQAAALWRRAAATCNDVDRHRKYEANARWCDDMHDLTRSDIGPP